MWLRPSWRMCLAASNISRHSRPGNDGDRHRMLPRCRAAMCLPSLLEEMHVKAKLWGGGMWRRGSTSVQACPSRGLLRKNSIDLSLPSASSDTNPRKNNAHIFPPSCPCHPCDKRRA